MKTSTYTHIPISQVQTRNGIKNIFNLALMPWAHPRLRMENYFKRPDKISIGAAYNHDPIGWCNDHYKTTDYVYILLRFNGIVDPSTQFTAGRPLVVPTKQQLDDWIAAVRKYNREFGDSTSITRPITKQTIFERI